MCHDLNYSGVLDRVKGFLEVNLKYNYFSLGLMTLMNILIAPCKAILYRSGPDETVLILVNEL